MKRIIKLYFNFMNEEKWLNKMSTKGYHLRSYGFMSYHFEEEHNTQYIYRIELLNQLPSHPESMDYLSFLEDTGVEVVSSYFRWVYLRKPASEGPFELHTDYASAIAHHKRILTFQGAILLLEIGPFLNTLFNPYMFGTARVFMLPMFGALCLILGTLVTNELRILRHLKKEQQIRES